LLRIELRNTQKSCDIEPPFPPPESGLVTSEEIVDLQLSSGQKTEDGRPFTSKSRASCPSILTASRTTYFLLFHQRDEPPKKSRCCFFYQLEIINNARLFVLAVVLVIFRLIMSSTRGRGTNIARLSCDGAFIARSLVARIPRGFHGGPTGASRGRRLTLSHFGHAQHFL